MFFHVKEMQFEVKPDKPDALFAKRLQELRVVDTRPSDPSAIYFGAVVEVEDLASGECATWRIVGPVLNAEEKPFVYKPGSWGPVEAMKEFSPPNGWIDPAR